MLINNVFTGLKEKFRRFLMQIKQLRALYNYSQVHEFDHGGYLKLIKKCLDDSYLGEKEADFLCYLVDKHKLNVLDWSYKSPWLKNEMRRIREGQLEETIPAQLEMFEDKAAMANLLMAPEARQQISTSQIPVHLLGKEWKSPWKRAR